MFGGLNMVLLAAAFVFLIGVPVMMMIIIGGED